MSRKNGKSGKQSPDYVWHDRKHWAWFPFSFTRYAADSDRLYITRGFFSKTYDETLLYRITDISLQRSLGQRIFGTGTIKLCLRVDHDSHLDLVNIKHSMETRKLLSQLIEDNRREKNVVGKEFYSGSERHEGPGAFPPPPPFFGDSDDDDDDDDDDGRD